jgi:hypothetical protein
MEHSRLVAPRNQRMMKTLVDLPGKILLRNSSVQQEDHIPFSNGPRSYLGRRLAQVKVVAVLAVIFQNYFKELAVDEWATDEVANMSLKENRKLCVQAQDKARKVTRGVTTLPTQITLKLHEKPRFIPVRLSKRAKRGL